MTSPKIKPLLLKPVGKDYLWGGERLKSEYNMQINMSPLAESWVCSTHPEGECFVCGGEFDGLSLRKVFQDNPSFMGRYANPEGQLPVLVKLIDAKENLSIQVHPDDEYARENENGSLGKHEMWYVLDSNPGTEIIHGFKRKMPQKLIETALQDGSINNLVRHIPIHKDEIFAVNPGTIHGIGAGALIAEIQENSNVTYRFYDYDRLDQNGQKRDLQIETALEVVDINAGLDIKQPMRVLQYSKGIASEFLYRCKYFSVDRAVIYSSEKKSFHCGDNYCIILCINGNGVIDGINIRKGNCVFVPAELDSLFVSGSMQLLKVYS